MRWLPDLADIANLTFRTDEHARILSELSEQLRALEARVRALEEPPRAAKA